MVQARSLGQGAAAKALLVLALCLTVASCGPSAEEQEQAREAERRRLVAASQKALAAFAERHGAMPVELFELEPLRRSFTANLQDNLEGSVVAFRGALLDIVRIRTGGGDYEVHVGDPFLGGTLVTLSTNEEEAAKLLGQSADEPSTLLVAARIDRVVPMALRLEPCAEPNCSDVSLEANRFESSHRISGNAIAIQMER